ncbi:nuclear pore complex protein NUP1 isoform X2 [Abrus precatorius]|uniref:Nuclear pore complex protein NUP1 isoform X2 n=1 Tax=Abrus precatorius TaxID=3816 RepID=A0A8B8MGM0_ABRPR|nr:nuclear pore complex protein NUP1 isoform X2 [Abrus precatorius]
MSTAREENPYEGGGGFGKFRKRPFRRAQTTPYDRPPTALRNPNRNNGWFSKLVDPAQRLIASSAHKLFASVFRKRLPPPSQGTETAQEVTDHHQETASVAANESSGRQGGVGETGIQINCSDGDGLTELEKLLKQKTFTRSEIDHLIELMRSRTVDLPVEEEGKRTEVIPSDPILPGEQKEEYPRTPALENGIDNHLISTPFVNSTVSIDDTASPAELAKAYMGSRPSKVSPSMLGLRSSLREDPTLLKGQRIAQKSPIMSIVPRATTVSRVHENGFVTPRSRGRSAIYSMAQTPYARVYPASTSKGTGVSVDGDPSQHALDHDMLSGSKQGALKRRSSVLDNDIGSFGPIRRIRHKSNLLSSKSLISPHSGSPLSINRSGVGIDPAQQPSSSMQKPVLFGEVKHRHTKLAAENVDDTMPSTSFPPLPSKSSEMASKILQQLDKLVSPKEKSSELRLPTVTDKSPTKLSSSMLRGPALRSMEKVDSSKFLDNLQDNELDGTLGNLSANAEKLTSKLDKVENGPLKLVAPADGIVPVVTDADTTVQRKQDISIVRSGDSSGAKPVSYSPQKKRAFHMSAHEDYLELDDDAHPNGAVPPFSVSGKETTVSTAVAEKITTSTDTAVIGKTPGSPVPMPFKSFMFDGKPHVRTADGSVVEGKVDVPTSIAYSVSDTNSKPTTGAIIAASNTSLGSDKCTSPNGSVGKPSLFNFGNKIVPSKELTAADGPPKESPKSGPIFGLEKVAPSEEPGANAPLVNTGFNKNVNNVSQVPFTFSSSVDGESGAFKFGAASDKPKRSISSTTVSGTVDSMPKAFDTDNTDVKTNVVTGFSARSSEPTVSSAASTSPANIFTFGNSSNQNNGPAASSPAFSSQFPPLVTNNFTSQNIFSSSSLAASNSSVSATATSSCTSITTNTPAVVPASNSSSSSQVVASSSPTTSFFKFGSTSLPSSLPVSSSGSEPVESKSRQNAGSNNIVGTSFGSSSAAVGIGSTGSGIFGFSSSAMTTVNSQSQGSVFGTTSGAVPGGLGSSVTSGFTTSSQSQSVALGSSASSPLFGLTGNTSFSSANSLFPSSSSTPNIFNSGTTSGQSTSASSSEANPVSSNGGTSATLFGLSNWQPSKSPLGSSFSSSASSSSGFSFGSSFSSSSSTSGFSFGASTPAVTATSSPMMFGSSTSASTPQFSFTSAAATTNMQPSFGSSSPAFTFGSASVSNDQMSMEDSMAEDTVQATPPMTPVFGQQPAPPPSNFVFGASTPTGASPFQFGSQQNIAPQNPSPFQASGSLEFNAGGSFSLGTGGGDKSGRKFVKVKHKPRKK